MQIELNQAVFRRLVQLYLLSLALLLGASAYSVWGPSWSEFSNEFDMLAAQHFGSWDDATAIPAGVILSMGVMWNLASTIGLLFFKTWARPGLIFSTLLLWLIGFVPGVYPSYSTVWTDAAGLLDGMLLGSILLMAYSRDHGGKWFAPAEQQLQETFN